MTTLPAKGVTPWPKVERQGDGDDVLGKRLDPVEVGQLSLDPEYSNDMLLCYCGNCQQLVYRHHQPPPSTCYQW